MQVIISHSVRLNRSDVRAAGIGPDSLAGSSGRGEREGRKPSNPMSINPMGMMRTPWARRAELPGWLILRPVRAIRSPVAIQEAATQEVR